jgi:transposase InsO family protein
MSTLNKWSPAQRDMDAVSKVDLSLARENGRLCRVGRLMRQKGISVVRTAKYKVATDSDHRVNIAPNLLYRGFMADAPNQKWPYRDASISYRLTGGRYQPGLDPSRLALLGCDPGLAVPSSHRPACFERKARSGSRMNRNLAIRASHGSW